MLRCKLNFIRKLWDETSFDWSCIDDREGSGGLVCIWRKDFIKMEDHFKEQR